MEEIHVGRYMEDPQDYMDWIDVDEFDDDAVRDAMIEFACHCPSLEDLNCPFLENVAITC
jgi:hypothetical protein